VMGETGIHIYRTGVQEDGKSPLTNRKQEGVVWQPVLLTSGRKGCKWLLSIGHYRY
jgi:hypothetical protein